MSDALALLQALGGPAALIARRNLTPDDDFDAILRAVQLDARSQGIVAAPEAISALAMSLRLHELAPPAADWQPPSLESIVEHALATPVEWMALLEECVAEMEQRVGTLAAVAALAQAVDPHGDYRVRRLSRCS